MSTPDIIGRGDFETHEEIRELVEDGFMDPTDALRIWPGADASYVEAIWAAYARLQEIGPLVTEEIDEDAAVM